MNHVSLSNRRIVLLAVMSLIASLLAVSFNAPRANAASEQIFFASATSVIEEDDVAGSITVPVTLTYDTSMDQGDVSATVVVTGTAGDPSDYTISGTAVSFLTGDSPPSGATHDVVITLVDNSTFEGNETVILTLTAATGATIVAESVHTVTINDTDDTPSIAIADIGVDEDDGTATFTVTRTGATTETVTADWDTVDGSASA
ncbi:MAG: hypothetical protein GY722_11925, partial [bacterium]|nr:hypothetical protein [bacterium]